VLFLRHVDAAATEVQTALLHVLETREFRRIGGARPQRADLRVVSATDRSLKRAAQAGAFREDLYYRLNGVTLRMPALRERPGDAALLAGHFLAELAPGKTLTAGAVDALATYPWPGNVRELRIVIERAALLANADQVERVNLRLDLPEAGVGLAGVGLGLTLAQMERAYIQTVLARYGGRRGKAARALGIDPKTLYNKLGPLRRRRRPGRAGTPAPV
jgi:DNA-binding NtrC family response regulator